MLACKALSLRVPEHQAVQALAQHGGQVMHHQLGVATVLEAGRAARSRAGVRWMHELSSEIATVCWRSAGQAGQESFPGPAEGARATGMARGSG